jgi:hypothetical protein
MPLHDLGSVGGVLPLPLACRIKPRSGPPPEQTHALFGNRAVDSWPGVLAPRNAENAERRLPRMACDRMIAAGITLRVVDPDANPPGSGP